MRQLETLRIHLKRLTPDLPAALSDLTQLRKLSISWGRVSGKSEPADDDDVRLADECLAAIGNMTRLETLQLSGLPLRGRGLACLAGARELKSLEVDFWQGDWKGSWLEAPVAEDSLRAIATLSQLEWLRLNHLKVHNEGLACLGGPDEFENAQLVNRLRPTTTPRSHTCHRCRGWRRSSLISGMSKRTTCVAWPRCRV